MEIQGIITAIAGVQKGTSAQTGNEWKTASYVVNIVNPTNSGSMVIDVKDGRDGRIAKLNLQVGKLYKLYIAFETNQWNGKYYNRIVCWGAREQSMTAEDAESIESTNLVNMALNGDVRAANKVLNMQQHIKVAEPQEPAPATEPTPEGDGPIDDLPF